MSTAKVILLSVLVCAAAVIGTFFFMLPSMEDMESRVSTTLVRPGTGEVIFVHQKVWGMTADKRVVFITGRSGEVLEPDDHSDYVYAGFSPLFYRQNIDTLEVYTTQPASVPKRFRAGLVIKQIVLDNAKVNRLLENGRYVHDGLKLVEIR